MSVRVEGAAVKPEKVEEERGKGSEMTVWTIYKKTGEWDDVIEGGPDVGGLDVVDARWAEVAHDLAERLDHVVALAEMLRASDAGLAPSRRALAAYRALAGEESE